MSTNPMPDRDIDEFQRIAGAFVHDFNNLYQTALGNLDLLSRRIDDPATAELVDETIISVERAVELTERLNLIGNKYPERFQRIDADEAIAAATRNMRETLENGREITFHDGAAGVSCQLPPGQLEKALATLIFEGPSALTRGPLSIETEVCEIAGTPEDLRPGTYIRITVSATAGASASPAVPPGFPTQETSIGFSLVRLFAAQLGGVCGMVPDAEKGTRFELLLPTAER